MIRWRLAQSSAWVYSVHKTSVSSLENERNTLIIDASIELQAWIKKATGRTPQVIVSSIYDYRNRRWLIEAKWVSQRKLHDEGEDA